ncbi:ImmA/IrrE family metallo-endopeptidase [Corynebacterium pilbarense]
MLAWALDSTGLPEAELEKRFPKLPQWHAGETRPTLKQARELAKLARIPFGRLLLDEPSGERVGVTDFRTAGNKAMCSVSADLRETIRSSQSRLAWYADFAAEEGNAPPTMYASATVEHDPGETAERTRQLLGIEKGKPLPGGDKVTELAAAMEDDGILVARNSIVGNSTARRLDVGEFRGFTIEDDGYVLVFVNTADAKTAQLFSLAHELGHVILGRTGISDHSEHADIERWCNKFAAAVIAPAEAVELPYTDADLHEDGAPPFDVVVRSRVGGRFFDTVTHAWSHGQITERDAARYLGASSYDSLSKLARA